MGLMQRFSDAGRALFATPQNSAALADMLAAEPKAAFGEVGGVGDSSSWLVRALGGQGLKTDAGIGVSEWTAITLPAVYACVSIIADSLAHLPLNIYRKRPGGGNEIATDHPLQAILHDQPNEDMSAFIYFQSVSHHALLWGNGYSEIERTRGGAPLALWPLYPDRTFPLKPAGEALRYRSQINGLSVTLPPEDVLHVPALGFDGYLGYSPVSVARQAIGMGLAMEKFGGKFFANDSKSGGFLMHPGKLGDEGQKNVTKSFQDQGGNENAFKVKVLEEGMKFISTTIPPDDAQFLSSREFQVAEIARIYRVPLVLLQSMEKATSWGSGIEQQMIGFVVYTLTPWLVRWEQEINRKLLTEAERKAGYYAKFNVNALVRGDMQARANFYRTLWNISSLNANEIRALEELPPYEGGDQYRVPTNTQDAEADDKPIDDAGPADPSKTADPNRPGFNLDGSPSAPPQQGGNPGDE